MDKWRIHYVVTRWENADTLLAFKMMQLAIKENSCKHQGFLCLFVCFSFKWIRLFCEKWSSVTQAQAVSSQPKSTESVVGVGRWRLPQGLTGRPWAGLPWGTSWQNLQIWKYTFLGHNNSSWNRVPWASSFTGVRRDGHKETRCSRVYNGRHLPVT